MPQVPTIITYEALSDAGREAGMAPELVAKVGDAVGQVSVGQVRAKGAPQLLPFPTPALAAGAARHSAPSRR